VEPVRRDRILAAANAFAGGTFLAGGFVHLLAEGDEFFDDYEFPLPVALVLCCVGLLLAFFIEKVIFLSPPRYTVMDHYSAESDARLGHRVGVDAGRLQYDQLDAEAGPLTIEAHQITPIDLRSEQANDPAALAVRQNIHHEHGHEHHQHHRHRHPHEQQQQQRHEEHDEHDEHLREHDHHRGESDVVNVGSSSSSSSSSSSDLSVIKDRAGAGTSSSLAEKAHGHSHGDGDHDHHEHLIAIATGGSIMKYMLVFILSLHSFISGVAMGIQQDGQQVLIVFSATAAHKWIEAFALGVSILRLGSVDVLSLVKSVSIYAVMTPAGVLVGALLEFFLSGEAADVTTAACTAFASGFFIYVALIDIMMEEFSEARYHNKYLKFLLLLVGFCLNASLVFLFSD